MDHPSGTYEMYNPKTKSRIVTTDSVNFASFKRWNMTEGYHKYLKMMMER